MTLVIHSRLVIEFEQFFNILTSSSLYVIKCDQVTFGLGSTRESRSPRPNYCFSICIVPELSVGEIRLHKNDGKQWYECSH